MKQTAALTLLLLAGACIPEEGPMMSPFEDCLGCHDGGEANAWTAAGTWAKGAKVSITDATGKNVPLKGNNAGNFYTAEKLTLPLTVSVNGKVMPDVTDPTKQTPAKLNYGGCNLCHRAEQLNFVPGDTMLPGQDCLLCHGAGGIAGTKFSAAGTFQPGDVVVVGGNSFTANSVGNFYFTAPITFPATARVNGASMSPDPDYGGCNRCHGPGGEASGGD